MDALVTAGGIPEPEDPLYEYTRGEPKALLDVAGQPLIQWVLDALGEARLVDRVAVIGLDSDPGLRCENPLAFFPNQGGLLQNIRIGTQKILELNPQAEFVLSVSSDIPAITGEMVDWLVTTTTETDHDVYYSVITREVMEARYPGSKRSFVRLKGQELCGGDMNVFRAALATEDEGIWERIIAARKSARKQAALIGFGSLLLLLMGRLTVEGAVERAGKRLGIRGRAIVCPYAELGMDVDKPYQLEILRADLARKALA